MEGKVLNQEVSHLNTTLDKLKNAKGRLDQSMLVMGQQNLEVLKDLRADPETNGADFFFFLESLHEKNIVFNFKDKYKKLDELESLSKEPYFARLDLQDKKLAPADSFYIGKFGYTEKIPVIIDWRAKIASIYYRYRYPQKNVAYDTPNGSIITDLLLKRTFEIDNGSFIKYYNNDIQLDENEIITEKIAHRTGGVLEDIVETIQISQLDIIEADPRQICVVQGCVGSGKSTVAIHKFSHIFFNFPTIIHPERSILIAKNQILVGYLSTLFPKLGIFDINYKSLRELIYSVVFKEGLQLNVDFDLNTDTSTFKLKDIKDVRKEIEQIHAKYKLDIENIFTTKDFESFGGFIYDPKDTVQENLNEAIENMEEELENQISYLQDHPQSLKVWLFKENISSLKKITNQLKKLRTGLKETTLKDLYKSLKLPLNGKMGYLETLIYLFIYSETVGLNKTEKYEYCVVDEGQDFSVLEYLVLGKIVLNGRFCILGDLNQSYVEEGIADWHEIAEVIKDAKNAQTFELDTNYRSTKPIIDLANKILKPYTKKYLPKSINRRGIDPIIETFTAYNDMMAEFEKDIKVETKDLNKSIGVIVFNSELLKEAEKILLANGLPADKLIKLDPRTKITYIPKGIYLTMFEGCKGLEFAKVYILDLNLTKIKDFNNAKKAFVAVTRAMNELFVFGLR